MIRVELNPIRTGPTVEGGRGWEWGYGDVVGRAQLRTGRALEMATAGLADPPAPKTIAMQGRMGRYQICVLVLYNTYGDRKYPVSSRFTLMDGD